MYNKNAFCNCSVSTCILSDEGALGKWEGKSDPCVVVLCLKS